MPVYREDIVDTKWASKRRLRQAALRRVRAMHLGKLGKIHCKYCARTFRHNNAKELVDAIGSSVRKTSFGLGTATAAAMAPAPQVEMRKYLGRVKSLEGNNVVAEIGPADDMDRWDVVIPRASFKEQPQVDQQIDCTIRRWGTHTDVTAQVLSNKRLPELKDFGIDEEELLTWASQLHV